MDLRLLLRLCENQRELPFLKRKDSGVRVLSTRTTGYKYTILFQGGVHVGSRQLVVFAINEEEFGIDIEHVNSIERMLELFKIPNTPDYIEGLVNLRGKVHTVFNLRKRFKLPCPEFTENTKIIMTNTSASIIGIIVDEVKKIVKVEDSDFEPTPKALNNLQDKFLGGIVKVEGRVVMVLDVEKIVSVEDLGLVK